MSTKTITSTLAVIAAIGCQPLWAADDTITATGTTTAAGSALATVPATTSHRLHDDAAYLQRIEPKYLSVAGSEDNLASIATGLRTGNMITLQGSTAPTGGTTTPTAGTIITFTPPTRPMGYGNITHTLDLAARELAAAGISSPTPDQLHAALMGGTVAGPTRQATTLPGILQLRSQGMGWGQIAHTLGVSLSPHSKSAGAAAGGHTASATASARGSGIATAAGASQSHRASGDKSGKEGIVTADGQTRIGHATNGSAATHARSGIVSAAGGGASFGAGIGTAQGGSAAGPRASQHRRLVFGTWQRLRQSQGLIPA